MQDNEFSMDDELEQERRKQTNSETLQSLSLAPLEEVEDGPTTPLKAAVLSALRLGQPAVQIAHRFGMSVSHVRQLEAAYNIESQRKEDLDRMLLVFVEQEISSLMAISIATSDEEWILRQSAPDLAEFVSAKQDRLMRILEAFGRAQSNRRESNGEVIHGR